MDASIRFILENPMLQCFDYGSLCHAGSYPTVCNLWGGQGDDCFGQYNIGQSLQLE